MIVTCQRLLTELGDRAWSGFNRDDMIFGADEARTALAELNAAHRYLQALEDFPWQSREESITAIRGVSAYPMIAGQLDAVVNKTTGHILKLIDKPQETKPAGEPEAFYITYDDTQANINLFPVPDKNYNIALMYNSYKFILGMREELQDEFQGAEDVFICRSI